MSVFWAVAALISLGLALGSNEPLEYVQLAWIALALSYLAYLVRLDSK